MMIKRTPVSLFFFYLLCVCIRHTFSMEENYVWIEFGEHHKENDASATQLLYIKYGMFPDNLKDIHLINELKGAYSLNEKDDNGELIYYPLEILKKDRRAFVRITSKKTNCFAVIIQGENDTGTHKEIFTAKTSFFLFGSARVKNNPEEATVPKNSSAVSITEKLHLYIEPHFSYWREVEHPVTVGISFNRQRMVNKAIFIIDENGILSLNPETRHTDKNGELVYIPPDDSKLRQRGTSAYKQTVITGEKLCGNVQYISSFTLLLHRSRFNHHDVVIGVIIFFTIFFLFIICILIQRKRTFS